jgi:hypothetical protein
MTSDRELLEQECKTNIDLRIKLDFIRGCLDKIDEAAKDGQDGSATYAFDRLSLIRDYVAVALSK